VHSGGSEGTITFLFTDIEGSTRQWESVPEMGQQVEAHFDVLRAAVEARNGRIFATMGDGVAAAFPSADAAIQAAIAAQEQLPATGLGVRMGLHTGEAQRVGDDYRGRPLNRAARIMGVAHAGQIVLSDLTATLVRNGPTTIQVEDLGTHRLRDLEDAERLWQVSHPSLAQQFPLPRGLDAYANNLPAQRSSLVGREDDVERVGALQQDHRVVTLTGVGGVGKTRLSLQVAADAVDRFRGVWFVPLASISDPDDVLSTIAGAVGLDGSHVGSAEALATALAPSTLLLLDNCEHVVEEAARIVDVLLGSCPDLHLLVTSREPLDVDGERVVPVHPLDHRTSGAELFRQRVSAAGGTISADDAAQVGEVCQRLDGLPLAIELAAARVPALGLAAVVAGLDDRFHLLAGARAQHVEHHQRMDETVSWSYRLLDDDEQRLFGWLAAFPAGFELDAVLHVGGLLGIEPDDARDVIASLAAKSMVVADQTPHGLRYRMLETLRAFAWAKVAERDEVDLALVAQADWVASLTDTPAADPCNADVEARTLRLDREGAAWRDAVLTATRLRSAELAGRLCGPPSAFFLLARHDLAEALPALLELCETPGQRQGVLSAMAVSMAGWTDSAQLLAWSDEIVALEADEPSGRGQLIRWIAHGWDGDMERAVQVCDEAADDPAYTQDTRDLFVGIATIDRFSLTWAEADVDGLLPRALEVIERSAVGNQRASSMLGAAWALRNTEPERSMALCYAALDELPSLPAYVRRTLPGNASRLLTTIDPRLAAEHLLQQLGSMDGFATFVELIPVFYAAVLLHRVDHPAAGPALATLDASPVSSFVSHLAYGDVADAASERYEPVPLDELVDLVRAGLEDVARAQEPAG
jgi:predicted ATPase/class 3 adenylate cyclase